VEARDFTGLELVDEWKAYQRASSKSSGMKTDQIQGADYMGFLQGVWHTASNSSLSSDKEKSGQRFLIERSSFLLLPSRNPADQ